MIEEVGRAVRDRICESPAVSFNHICKRGDSNWRRQIARSGTDYRPVTRGPKLAVDRTPKLKHSNPRSEAQQHL